MNIEELIRNAAAFNASDIHLVRGLPPKCRVDGELQDLDDEVLTGEMCESLARELAGDAYEQMEKIGELDLARTIADHRIRINLFRQRGTVSAALRILSDRIPDLRALGLPEIVMDFPSYDKGIVLVTGETGSGKSTTLAAILDEINHTRNEHIITLEDPVEYLYEPDRCIINQREIGTDTRSYEDGLRAILREDPDVILIGEMRDRVSIETAVTAAETGHLVFSTLHTDSAVDSIDRMVAVFPADRQPEIRMEISTTIRAVLSQQLLPSSTGRGRVAACEVMIATPAIRNLIREGKTPQMNSSMQSSSGSGSLTMDNCLIDLASRGEILPETALAAASDPAFVKKKIMMM